MVNIFHRLLFWKLFFSTVYIYHNLKYLLPEASKLHFFQNVQITIVNDFFFLNIVSIFTKSNERYEVHGQIAWKIYTLDIGSICEIKITVADATGVDKNLTASDLDDSTCIPCCAQARPLTLNAMQIQVQYNDFHVLWTIQWYGTKIQQWIQGWCSMLCRLAVWLGTMSLCACERLFCIFTFFTCRLVRQAPELTTNSTQPSIIGLCPHMPPTSPLHIISLPPHP